jgi:Domain of unknown function (DUF4326)
MTELDRTTTRVCIPEERKAGRPYEEPHLVYCGNAFTDGHYYKFEASDWRNPHYEVAKTHRYEDHLKARQLFREYVLTRQDLLDRLLELDGKLLGCWCPLHLPCHVDVLIELLEERKAQLAGTLQDAELRAQIFRYSLEEASPQIRRHIQHLCGRWIEYNRKYFDGALVEPFLAFEEPGFTTCYGQYCPVSAFGGSGQIMIRPSLLAGTLQHFREGNKDPEGLERFMDQVLLHEMIHQWQHEVNHTDPGEFNNYGGHGSTFSGKANEIGSWLDLPPVRLRNKKSHSGKTAHLPNPSHWPHNVTPHAYYLGAYVPASKDEDEELRKALYTLLAKRGLVKVERVAREVWEGLQGKPERS